MPITDVAEMPNPQLDSLAYMKRSDADTPWHGLGVAVNSQQTVDEWITSAKLDWTVQKRKLYMRENRDSEYATVEIPNQYAVAKAGSNQVFNFVTDRYHVVQNKEVVEMFRTYCEAGEMEIDTLGSLREGNIIWCQANIGKQFTLAGNDTVKGKIFIANSHDGTLVYQGRTTNIRIVCMNTFRRAGKDGVALFKMKHSRKITPEIIADAKLKMAKAIAEFTRSHEAAQLLSETKVPDKNTMYSYLARLNGGGFLLDEAIKGYEESQNVTRALATKGSILDAMILDDVYIDTSTGKSTKYKLTDESFNRAGKSVIDSIVNSPGANKESAKGTWWGVVNGVSYYTDHLAGRNPDSTMTNAWLGQRASLKDEAVELAVKYATVN